MALGLKDAAYIFTKLTKPLLGYFCGLGNRSILYIDDALNARQSFEGSQAQVVSMHTFFSSSCWFFKCVLVKLRLVFLNLSFF